MLDNIAEITINDYELENTNVQTDIFTTLCVLPCNTYYGGEQVIVKNVSQLTSLFGTPSKTNYKFWWNAWNYLQYGSTLNVVRPVKDTWENASLKFLENKQTLLNMTPNINSQKKAESFFSNYELESGTKFEVFNRFVTNENNTSVIICDNDAHFNSSITDEKIDVVSKKDVCFLENCYDQEMAIVKRDSIVISGIAIEDSKCVLYLATNDTLLNIGSHFYISLGDLDNETTLGSKKFSVTALDTNFLTNNLFRVVFGGADSEVLSYLSASANTIDLQVDDVLNADLIALNTVNSPYNKDFIYLNKTTNKIYYHFPRTKDGIWKEVSVRETSKIYCKQTRELITLLPGINPDISLAANTEYRVKHELLKNKNSDSSGSYLSVCKPVNLPFKTDSLGNLKVLPCYTKALYGDLNPLTKATDGEVVKFSASSESFSPVTVIVGKRYYVESLKKAFEWNGSEWLEKSEEYYLNPRKFASLKLYESSLYKADKSVATFKDIMQYNPDFSKEFVLLVLKKNDNVWYLKEKMLLTYDNYIHPVFQKNLYHFDYVFNNSSFIYLKAKAGLPISGTLDLEKCIILDNSGEDYCNVDYQTFFDLIKELEDVSNSFFNLILGFEFDETYNLTNDLADNRKNCLNIVGPWDESKYLPLSDDEKNNAIIFNYGTGAFTHSSVGRYTASYNNMKLQADTFNGKDIWLPITGDVAGLITAAVNAKENTPAGLRFGEIKNCKKLLYSPKTDHNRSLNTNGVNTVLQESFSKKFLLSDLLTLEKSPVSIYRDLYAMITLVALKAELYDYCYGITFTKQSDSNLSNVRADLQKILSSNNNINKREVDVAYGKSSLSIRLSIGFYGITKKINISIYSAKNYITIIES